MSKSDRIFMLRATQKLPSMAAMEEASNQHRDYFWERPATHSWRVKISLAYANAATDLTPE